MARPQSIHIQLDVDNRKPVKHFRASILQLSGSFKLQEDFIMFFFVITHVTVLSQCLVYFLLYNFNIEDIR